MLPLEDRSVPCLLAYNAFVDKPCIELATIGVEPDFAAGLECSDATASAACDPRLGRCCGYNGPLDVKYIAHTVLVFRSEVHQDGA